MGPWWPRPLPHRALPGVRYSAPIRPSRQISTAFTREPSILRSRSVYNFILWPAGDKTHFPGETSQLLQISIISIKLLIVLCRRQCFMPHLRSFIKELLPTSFIVYCLCSFVQEGDTPCPMLNYSFAFLFPKKHGYMRRYPTSHLFLME